MHSQSFNLGELAKSFKGYQGLRGMSMVFFGRFVDHKAELKNEFRRTRATATGGALVNFFNRKRRSKRLDLTILVNRDEYVREIGRFFLTEGYKTVEIPTNSTCYQEAYKSTDQRRSCERSVTIMKCHGSSELQAVLMANNTGEVVTLTSSRVVCMYPLLGLIHQCAYWFSGERSQSKMNGYKCVTSHKLPGQDPLAKAMRAELGEERSLGDKQCFIIPPYSDQGGRSGWTIEIQSKSMVTWVDKRLGLISGDWQTLRQMIPILQKDQHDRAKLHFGALMPNNYESEIMEVHKTPVLSDLVKCGDTDAMKQQIKRGADVNVRDNFDRLVLSCAIEQGQTDIAKLLIERGADVNVRDNFDRSVLSCAIKQGQTDIAKLLIECGALKRLENSVTQGTKDQPYLAQTKSQDGAIKLGNTTVSGYMIDVTTTDTWRHIQYHKGVIMNGKPIPDTKGDFIL